MNVLDKLFGLTLIRGVGSKCTDVYKINSKLHKNREIAIYFYASSCDGQLPNQLINSLKRSAVVSAT